MKTLRSEERLENVLRALAMARPFAPDKAGQCEDRIRFGVARFEDLQRPNAGAPVRTDRFLAGVAILEGLLSQAEAFLDLIASCIIVRRVA